MRKETLLVSERNLMFVIAGQLYSQAPNCQPREADKILMAIRDKFRTLACEDHGYYIAQLDKEELRKFIETELKNIPEFNNLNLSQDEVDKGIGLDDERPKYSFTSRYSVVPWKSDFIDLDAFTRNVYNELLDRIDNDSECFFCGYNNTDRCKTCRHNKDFTNNCASKREYPCKSEHTFACKYDCYRHFMCCCEECSQKDTCEADKKCDGNSKTCGNAINHDKAADNPEVKKNENN